MANIQSFSLSPHFLTRFNLSQRNNFICDLAFSKDNLLFIGRTVNHQLTIIVINVMLSNRHTRRMLQGASRVINLELEQFSWQVQSWCNRVIGITYWKSIILSSILKAMKRHRSLIAHVSRSSPVPVVLRLSYDDGCRCNSPLSPLL